jgi:hypothetical protein
MHYAPVNELEYANYELHRSRMYAKMLEMEDAYGEDHGRDAAPYQSRLAASLESAWRIIYQNAPAPQADSAHVNAWVKFLRGADEKARAGYLKNWVEATPDTIARICGDYQQVYEDGARKWEQSLESWRARMAREVLQNRALPERPKPKDDDPSFFAAVTFNGGPMDIPESPRVTYLRQEYQRLKDTLPPEPGLISAVAEGPSIEQRVFIRGQMTNPGDIVPKRFPLVLAGEDQPPIKQGSGRLELANWLASPSNPLTPRVIVNHIWQWHFGDGIVRTSNNWGRTGEKPAHPELLDFLASRFIEGGWSIKKLHRLIMLSDVYQRAATAPSPVRQADPSNRLLARFPRQRMSIEQLRDSILAIDGSIDTALGGTLLIENKGKRQKADPEEITRRTIYIPVRRGSIPPLFNIFDFGDATTSGDGRSRTNVAPQALFLRNSKFAVTHARNLASQLLDSSTEDAKRVERAYLTVFTRRPEPAEIDEALSYIAASEKRIGTPHARLDAWQSFCHVLISSSEFLYID